MSFSGLLPINKPENLGSKDVARRIMRFVGKQKIGHVGTLDPFASGVLPLLFGKATKVQDYLLSTCKTYECEILLGSNTDTLDRDGEALKSLAYDHVTKELIEEKLKTLLGEQIQEPPIYSAVKYKGKALYKYARSDKAESVPVEKLKRKVNIFSIDFLSFDGERIYFSTKVSKGTYIRVLAQTLVNLLGTAGHVTKLIRTESSLLDLEDCYKLDPLLESLEKGESLESFLVPVSKIKIDLPQVRVLSELSKEKLLQGQKIVLIKEGVIKDSFLFSQEKLNSCSSSEVILEDEKGLLFAIGETFQEGVDLLLKVRRGLV